MVLQHRMRIVVGLALIAVGIAIAAYRTTVSTRLVSDVTLERPTPPTDVDVTFGTEVEERMVSVDLRIPAVFGIIGVGLIASAFIHRRN